MTQLVGYANQARKKELSRSMRETAKHRRPFLKKSLMLAVDGTEPQELRKMMELELDNMAEHGENIPKVFESAGGFSPTIGIIGAVFGTDPGDAAPGEYRRGRARHRGCVCGDDLWCRFGQPLFSPIAGKLKFACARSRSCAR